MNGEVKIFSTPEVLANRFAEDIMEMIKESSYRKRSFTLALSGGNTSKLLFPVMAKSSADLVSWERVHFFWVDERCVPPEDPESNFGVARSLLLDNIKIPSKNIHRIMGEMDPSEEAIRYSAEIAGSTVFKGRLPAFDLIILGLGEDGHTASIFNGNNKLFMSEKICETTVHPVNHQKRITITGAVINNADNIVFVATGEKKSQVVSAILRREGTSDYPAEHVNPVTGILKWYLDETAAKLIER